MRSFVTSSQPMAVARLAFQLTVLFGIALFLNRASGSEIVLKNDSLPPSGGVASGFLAGWRLGAVLDVPADGTIVGVDIFWGAADGNPVTTQTAAIRISNFAEVNFQNTLTSGLATIDQPILHDGENEFRFLDPATNALPLSAPVTAGTSIFVEVEMLDDTGSAGFVMDADGDHPNRNLIYLPNPQAWADATLGIYHGGDFGIRAILQPVPEPSSIVLLVSGLLFIIAMRRVQNRGS